MDEIEKLWQENEVKLKMFIRARVSSSCDADDILHTVFLKVKHHSSTVRDPKKAQSWLYQVTRNAIIDHYRAMKKMVELPEDLREEKPQKNAWELISRCVRPFVEDLPPIYREALLLSEIEGLDQKEVAKRLKIPLATAKARIQRGRLKLKKKFDDCCIFECGPRGAQIHSDTFEKEEE